jgi:hypothetical protein
VQAFSREILPGGKLPRENISFRETFFHGVKSSVENGAGLISVTLKMEQNQ